jgi:ABC-type maltose transport system permease subunit
MTLTSFLIMAFMVIIITIIVVAGVSRVSFETQSSMTKRNSDVQKDISYDEFLKLFKSHTWYIEDNYRGSFFDHKGLEVNQIHADIWKMDNIGLLAEDYKTYKKVNDFLNNLWDCKQKLDEWKK